jgi:uncharacterized protein YndB with AHSA1/START domain
MARSLLRQMRYLATAAAEECGRAGHPAVDLDHLLLALLCSGGPSARLLTGAGVTLPAAREACRALQAQDLALLGVTAPVPPPARQQEYGAAARAAEWAPRALAVVREVPARRDDRALLAALLDEPAGVARGLLRAAGADDTAVEAALAAPGATDDPGAPGTAPAAPEPAVGPRGVSVTTLLPAPRAAVWALLADPSRRPEWDSWCSRVDVGDDGTVAVTLRHPRGREVTSTSVVSRWRPPASIAWSDRLDRPGAGLRHLRVDLVAAGAGCEVTLTRWSTPRRAIGRVAAVLARPLVRSELRFRSQSIAQAVTGG